MYEGIPAASLQQLFVSSVYDSIEPVSASWVVAGPAEDPTDEEYPPVVTAKTTTTTINTAMNAPTNALLRLRGCCATATGVSTWMGAYADEDMLEFAESMREIGPGYRRPPP
jgi:hypothetical protein